jgi:small subunit ribosomal protein S20
MANIKSQKKRIKTNAKAQERNKAVRSELKTRVKTAANVAASAGADAPETVESLKVAVKRLDQAAAKGVIHPNQAANRKSGLMKRINALLTK